MELVVPTEMVALSCAQKEYFTNLGSSIPSWIFNINSFKSLPLSSQITKMLMSFILIGYCGPLLRSPKPGPRCGLVHQALA